ncbi:hypothetical protein NDU88_005803 [Pleurodeles waltl]|uniref:Uncharacterized protein n=1 Tax=Pleurodeles waltl TaxID=8319 RepID=A0AAV7L2E6_PLEWA|nr:hypothetical protein NDU88_005803 [Pleurodeles waltl]
MSRPRIQYSAAKQRSLYIVTVALKTNVPRQGAFESKAGFTKPCLCDLRAVVLRHLRSVVHRILLNVTSAPL